MINVGAAIAFPSKETRTLAGSSVQKMYLFAPVEWWHDLDVLFDELRNVELEKATETLEVLNRLISKEINEKL